SGGSAFRLLSVVSDELDEPVGPHAGDIHEFRTGTSDTSGLLRAQRSKPPADRIYTLEYEGADLAGNMAGCTTTVAVGPSR
ncbi:MAG TPA: hypothetical protein VM841_04215, partial [Actinomycetota bacterium]|nr:hypothetical protein [Actinomycetota bacterium]